MKNSLVGKTPKASIHLVLLLLVVAGLSTEAVAQTDSNGISVGRPKVFDNRSLQIMLEELNRQLETVKTVDQAKLLAALGMQQGSEASDVRRSFELKTAGLPGTVTEEAPNASGDLVVSKRTTTDTAVNPTLPELPDLQTAPTFVPTFGQNAIDVLSDQVSLSYQIFNTRMLLERSLTDRLLDDDSGPKLRLQAVLGFQISLDPPKEMRDHAAYVEVTVTPVCSPCSGEVSLVSMMPFEKTYNSSALSQKATAFGGSAVAKVLTLGYNQTNRQQHFYLFRDADTSAMEDLSDPEALSSTFGWVFRPVLGRRAVSPGIRQMLAVVALPQVDDGAGSADLKVEVRTYWRKYRRNRLTTERATKLEAHWTKAAPLKVYTSKSVEENLGPVIEEVLIANTDATTSIATIQGKNFFTGTKVMLGSKVLSDPATGLTIKSDRTMELRLPTRELAFGDAVVSGRYGGAATVLIGANKAPLSGLRIVEIKDEQEGRDSRELVVSLQDRDGGDLVDLPAESPLLTVGESLVVPHQVQKGICEAKSRYAPAASKECWEIRARVPKELLVKDVRVGVRYPLRGSNWADSGWVYGSPFLAPRLVSLGKHDKKVRMVISGIFDDLVEVRLDKPYRLEPKNDELTRDGNYLTLTLPEASLEGMKRIVLAFEEEGERFLRFLDLEEPPAPAVKPSIDKHDPQPATKGSAGSVEFPGKALDKIKTAWSEGKELRVKSKADGTAITVFLTREVTKEVGPVKILLEAQDGTLLPADVVITP